jgi:hypothetical protein
VPRGLTAFLGLGSVILDRNPETREVVVQRVFKIGKCIGQMPPVRPALREPNVMPGDAERVERPAEVVAAEEWLDRNR